MLVLFLGCDASLATKSISFEHECWNITDTLTLDFENKSISTKYSIQLDLVFSNDYRYNNMYAGLITKYPDGKTKQINVPLVLMDNAGNWYGEGTKTISHHADLTRAENLHLEGKYKFRLFQFMQEDLLCGIKSAKFSIRENE